MSAAGRLLDGAARWGIVVGPGEAEALAPLVDRVEAALREPTQVDASLEVDAAPAVAAGGGTLRGGAVAPEAHGAGTSAEAVAGASEAWEASAADDGAWVWRDGDAGGGGKERAEAGSPDAGPPDAGPGGAGSRRAGSRGAGALRGWRVGVKDVVAVVGRPLRCGSAATFDAPPEPVDAAVVTSLREAGAVLVGATKLHEFAFGTTGLNAVFGTPANPAAPGRIPGGSSSGSGVAVAAGEADLAIGTDTGGSVRIPAALCGVVGFKPSWGVLSTAGVFALSPTLDHVGYLVRDVERLVAPARALGLPTPGDGDVADGLRLGVAAGAAGLCDPGVAAHWQEAVSRLAGAGIGIVDVEWPGGEAVFAATTAIMFAEAAHLHAARLTARHHLYGADVRARLVQGGALGAGTYLRARAVRRQLRSRCLATLAALADAGRIGAVVTPTVPVVAPRLEDAADPAVGARLVTFTRLADVTGLPAVSVPLPGVELPVGLQVEAADDATAILVARAVGRRLVG